MAKDSIKRKKELIDIICKTDSANLIKAEQLIDEIVFIEEQLAELRKYPFLPVNPNNTAQQRATPASKQYKELLQQYNNSLKLLFRLSGEYGETEEESPLRKWIREKKEIG
jgi:hypothetical protein